MGSSSPHARTLEKEIAMRERIRKHLNGALAPLATTFTGVGGLAFHFNHGPEHIFCLLAASGLAIGGTVWSFINRARVHTRYRERR